MKAPKKVIAAMAMATMIGGTVAPAFADFETIVENGKNTIQRSNGYQADGQTVNVTEQGDIRVTGNFTKHIDTFPNETRNGHYLRVTMPISLTYEYNLDDDSMHSAKGDIINQSVFVTGAEAQDSTGYNEEGKSVKMSFIGLQNLNGNNSSVEYVDDVNEGAPGKAKLPFELKLTTNRGDVQTVSLASMQKANPDSPAKSVTVKPDSSLKVEIQKIGSQNVKDDANILGDSVTSVSHNMKLKFEYLSK